MDRKRVVNLCDKLMESEIVPISDSSSRLSENDTGNDQISSDLISSASPVDEETSAIKADEISTLESSDHYPTTSSSDNHDSAGCSENFGESHSSNDSSAANGSDKVAETKDNSPAVHSVEGHGPTGIICVNGKLSYTYGPNYSVRRSSSSTTPKSFPVKHVTGPGCSMKSNVYNIAKSAANLPRKTSAAPVNSKVQHSSNYPKPSNQTQSQKPLNKSGSGFQSTGLVKGLPPASNSSSHMDQSRAVYVPQSHVNYQPNGGASKNNYRCTSQYGFRRKSEFEAPSELSRDPSSMSKNNPNGGVWNNNYKSMTQERFERNSEFESPREISRDPRSMGRNNPNGGVSNNNYIPMPQERFKKNLGFEATRELSCDPRSLSRNNPNGGVLNNNYRPMPQERFKKDSGFEAPRELSCDPRSLSRNNPNGGAWNNNYSSTAQEGFGRTSEFEAPRELSRGPRSMSRDNTLKPGAKVEWTNLGIDTGRFNSPDFQTEYKDARFHVIKSFSEDDVQKCIKYDVWSSTPYGNKKLDDTFRDADAKVRATGGQCPIFLFFSVNGSGQFVGVAEMIGPVDFSKNMQFWKGDLWDGFFPVQWHIIKDVPSKLFQHIILKNCDNRPTTRSRDTQEIELKQGIEILTIFKKYKETTTLLDDFNFYEDRQRSFRSKANVRNVMGKQLQKTMDQFLPQSSPKISHSSTNR